MIAIRIILAVIFLIGLFGDWNQSQRPDVGIIFSATAFASGAALVLLLLWPEVAL